MSEASVTSPSDEGAVLMPLLGFDVPAPKFKFEDTVWVYFDPRGLEDHCELPIFECEVNSCSINAKSEYGEKPEVDITYYVSINGSFDEPVYKKEADVFATREEAANHALEMLRERTERIVANAEKYKAMLADLEA